MGVGRKTVGVLLLVVSVVVPAQPVESHIGHCPKYEWLLKQQGLPVRQFSKIMWRESGCQPTARNVNRNGTVDRGLLQLNSIHMRPGGVAYRYAPAQLYDPMVNVRLAGRLYRISGARPWR